MLDVRFINDSITKLKKEAFNAELDGKFESAIRYQKEIAQYYLKLAKESTNIDLRNEYIEAIKATADKIDTLKQKSEGVYNKEAKPLRKKSDLSSKLTKKDEKSDDDLTEFAPIKPEDIKVGLDDVCGLDNVKDFINENVILPKEHPEIFETFKIPGGNGLLMYGLPGNGKTMIAKAIAKDTEAPFYQISCSDILSKWRGDSEKNLTKLLETATQNERAIIFFDEFETLGSKRGGRSSYDNKFVAHFLSALGGFKENNCQLLVIAATNRPWDIDDGLLRSGRFGTHLYIPLPDPEARYGIIKHNLSDVPVELSEDDFKYLVCETQDFSGSDVAQLCNNIKKRAAKISLDNKEITPINAKMMNEVLSETHSTVDFNAAKKIKDYNEENHVWTPDCTSGVPDDEHITL